MPGRACHPKVKAVTLVAMPDPVFGEKACAFVIPKEGQNLEFGELIDYPCRTGLPAEVIEDAVGALRANDSLVPLLRLRIADLETRLVDLTGNNIEVLRGLQAVANEQP